MRFSQQIGKGRIDGRFVGVLVAIFSGALSVPALAQPVALAPGLVCSKVSHREQDFTVCAADPKKVELRTFWADGEGRAWGGFDRLAADAASKGGALIFAMNGGMYHPDYRPVGLYVENGREIAPLNRRAGKGNFSLKPNGVFWVRGREAGVTESGRFQATGAKVDFATQSGPMLVVDGKLHPKIRDTGTSEKTRNGVGQCDDGAIKFAISEDYVTFHKFATLFSETLKCSQALFLDGSVSSLYAPALKRNDGWAPLGPIIGVVAARKG